MQEILLDEFLKATIKEDLGRGDLFARILKEDKEVKSKIIAKEDGVFSGEIYIKRMCELYCIEAEFLVFDKEEFQKGTTLLNLRGKRSTLLSLERSILNILAHSSGIATLTRRFVKKLQNTDCVLLDTRKTRPLLRVFEKYSTKNGGARNHRLGLDDCLMLKDTHIKGEQSLEDFIKEAREKIPFGVKIEVECETLEQARAVLTAKGDILMCDNMPLELIKEVVDLRDKISPSTLIEVSGNVELENIANYAIKGVNAISSGYIIHHATWIDLSMKML
ncbi:nicotinate-nucleotide diphosphorylase (carboxylating) [Helicobacter valdiviensis]|uniref:nicotinate-nucleotide diphosphorylase (carboxylating) n=1 Tax=Helicobacter valdiviensis TaxID=1458358 RepID=A0A2W6MV84_9HELI|nr:carboxylating nicotinate-nucleotide diphosphorylase [Helicobacter valdiviensis]PZT47829.1 nicotinate-nucleotide diphosphorylase (carboxylating) [Helicobacter valdiviensis]